MLSLWAGVLDGLRTAATRTERITGIGIDSWAIDYGLLDSDGRLLGNPVHYRDRRTDGVADEFDADRSVRPDRCAGAAVQHDLPTGGRPAGLAVAAGGVRALLIPDLFGYWLTGRQACELTNASTTGLLDVQARQWDPRPVRPDRGAAAVPGEVSEPGTVLGPVLPSIAGGLGDTVVSLVGSHDTASAVAGVPAAGPTISPTSPAEPGRWSASRREPRC